MRLSASVLCLLHVSTLCHASGTGKTIVMDKSSLLQGQAVRFLGFHPLCHAAAGNGATAEDETENKRRPTWRNPRRR